MQLDYYKSPLTPKQPPHRHKKKKTALVVFLVLIGLLLAGLILLRVLSPEGPLFSWELMFPAPEASVHDDHSDHPDSETDRTDEPEPAGASKNSLPRAETAPDVELTLTPAGAPLSFQEIYQKNISSIVSIEVYNSTSGGSGTGIIMTRDGYIITNHHIVADMSEGWVVLADGREFEALLVGSDVESDLAVLKINARGLFPAEFGNSNDLQVGDTVLAIGNPLGSELFGTMTEGIVSAINRDVNADGYTMSLIQTTAALNPGNSGGALINTAGQVIGITNMKMMSNYGTIEGLGFAIPTVWAKEVVDTLLDRGQITGRPTIGIMCFALEPGSGIYYGLDRGIYIDSVTAGGPAEKAGLQSGDIVTAVNGQQVATLEEFTLIRDQLGVGGVMHLTVWRSGETFETDLTLIEQYELN